MNKLVAILGFIVLITLGGLFFCAGFFTGTFTTPHSTIDQSENNNTTDNTKQITMEDVSEFIDTQSENISDKISEILASVKDYSHQKNEHNNEESNIHTYEEKITVDSLLKEIAIPHTLNDDCSAHKTVEHMNAANTHSLEDVHKGKIVVFIGYFKDVIALQIQQLLEKKGYKTHVELSNTGSQNDAFVFCGPFKKEKNANKLVKWLKRHNFSEARLLNVTNHAIEETLYEFMGEESSLPENEEKHQQVSA